MKTGTLDKMKFMVLKNRLQLPRYAVIGLLEGLWYLTATSTPEGNIGRFTNEEIAAWLEWSGEAEVLVATFIETGFLDKSEKHRLVVHDWAEHCPNHVSNNLKRWGKTFVQPAKDVSKDLPMDDPKESPMDDPPNQTRPDPVKPDQTKPSQTSLGAGTGVSAKRTGTDWGKSVFSKLKVEHLRDTEVMADWFLYATTEADRPLFSKSGGHSQANFLFVLAATERAIEEGDDPLKLFKHLIGKEKRDLITQAQEGRAKKRL